MAGRGDQRPDPAAGLLRAARGYELVARERCTPAEREQLVGMPEELAYGVLRPRPGADLPPVAVSPDTALLVLTLAEPGPLPAYARAALGAAASSTITALMHQGVLELEHRGEWYGGPGAAALLGGAFPRAS